MPDERTRLRGDTRAFASRQLPALSQGDVLAERYEIIEQVGKGAFAAVYRVWDLKLDMEKALKVFPDGMTSAERDALHAEANILARLNHPGVARLYDFNEQDRFPLLDMEYMQGGSLRERLDHKKLPRRQALHVAAQLAEGLHAAHMQNIIHRDIKPSNVLLDDSDRACLGDFGIADDLSRTGDVSRGLGANDYIAPEIVDGLAHSTRSDIFSFGVTLYEMVYGELPFTEDPMGRCDYMLPRRLLRSQQPVDRVLRRCLAATPEQRYESAAELAGDLREAEETSKDSPARELVRIIYMVNPLRLAPQNIRRELMSLVALLALMAVLAPMYMRTVEREALPEHEITFQGAPLAVFVNLGKRVSPRIDDLKPGDQLQFRDRFGTPLFDYTYQGEDPLHLTITRDSIFINDTLVGRRIRSRDDLPLEPNLPYVATDIPLSDSDWAQQNNPNLAIRLGRMAPRRTLDNLPQQTHFLNLHGNSIISGVGGVARLERLRGLDVSDINGLFPQGLEYCKSLRQVNLARTGLRSTAPIASLNELEHIDISRNRVDGLQGLSGMTKLKTLDINGNQQPLEHVEPVLNLPNLVSISRLGTRVADPEMDRQLRDLEEQLNALNPQQRRTVEERVYRPRTVADRVIFVLAILALLAVLGLLIRIMLLRLPRPQQGEETDKNEKQSKPDRANLDRELHAIDDQIRKGDVYTPPEANAAEAVRALQKDHPTHPGVQRAADSIVNAVKAKVRSHTRHREFEPAWMAASAAAEALDDSRLHVMSTRLRNELELDDEILYTRISGGSFEMGDFAEGAMKTALPVHTVEVDDFQLSRVAVSNNQYCRFLNAAGRHREGLIEWINLQSPYCKIVRQDGRYSTPGVYGSFPVIEVSWHGAQRFCEWIGGRLPTEAEWEYAARNGGKKVLYPTGSLITKKQANYLVDPEDGRWHSIVPVRSFKPNKLALHEMAGNVLEWCYDWFGAEIYARSPRRNPSGPSQGTLKVVRGGGWCFPKKHMRTYYRGSAKPASRTNFIGFRVARNS